MGPTGSGKSTFIGRATCQDPITVAHGWRSDTSEIRTVRAKHPTEGYPVVFVDTPGFDHTNMSDMEILIMIAEWLVKAYKENANLATVLYLHRISDNRMSGSAMKNLRIFSNLCGRDAMPNVVIVTTMWSKVDVNDGIEREKVLKQEVWKPLLNSGCRVERFDNTHKSAWDIVEQSTGKDTATHLLVQTEMVDSGKTFEQTQAGSDLSQAAGLVGLAMAAFVGMLSMYSSATRSRRSNGHLGRKR